MSVPVSGEVELEASSLLLLSCPECDAGTTATVTVEDLIQLLRFAIEGVLAYPPGLHDDLADLWRGWLVAARSTRLELGGEDPE